MGDELENLLQHKHIFIFMKSEKLNRQMKAGYFQTMSGMDDLIPVSESYSCTSNQQQTSRSGINFQALDLFKPL